MSKDSDQMQTPIPFTFAGKEYPLAPCTGEIELAYTNWLEMRARDKIARRKKDLGGEYQTHLAIWQQRVDADEYDWSGYIAFMSRQAVPGQKHLLYLLLAKQTPTATPALVDRIHADSEKWRELFDDGERDEDGKAVRPPGLVWRAIIQARPTSPPPTNGEAST